MKRFHVHVSVKDLQDGVRFYSAMFGQQPTVVKDDYAKWMLDDPRVNFAISNRSAKTGVDHLGIQVESAEELSGVEANLHRASDAVQAQSGLPAAMRNRTNTGCKTRRASHGKRSTRWAACRYLVWIMRPATRPPKRHAVPRCWGKPVAAK